VVAIALLPYPIQNLPFHRSHQPGGRSHYNFKLESIELHQLTVEQIQNLDAYNVLLP
jgi:hypothetical protein